MVERLARNTERLVIWTMREIPGLFLTIILFCVYVLPLHHKPTTGNTIIDLLIIGFVSRWIEELIVTIYDKVNRVDKSPVSEMDDIKQEQLPHEGI